MVCKRCNCELPDGAVYCGSCGCKVHKKGSGGGILIAAVLIIAVLVAGVCFFGGGKNQEPEMYYKEVTAAMEAEPGETEPTRTEALTPEELLEHVLLCSRVGAPLEVLRGKMLRDEVVVTVFFVEDPESHWTQEEMEQKQAALEEAAEVMEQEAARYGAFLDLRLVYHEGLSLTTDVVVEYTWACEILAAAGMPWLKDYNQTMEDTYGVETAVSVFFLNRPGRDHAWGETDKGGLMLHENTDAFRHELYHLFGAVDYYYPSIAKEQAEIWFPESLMLNHTGEVDALTAYLIGWTDELSDDAMAFLQATASLTWETYYFEDPDRYHTGYIEKEIDDGTYTGGMVEGLFQGQGKLVWNDGSVYEGEWVSGERRGQGTMTWSDGLVYTGQWNNDKPHGQGIMTWNDGSVYEGEWADGEPSGMGAMTWNDGAVYIGQWENGCRNGLGTITWANGVSYYGQWQAGKRHGEGSMIYPIGFVLSGIWEDGIFAGWFR